MVLTFLFGGVLAITIIPDSFNLTWVVDAIWSNGSIEVWSNPTWFNSETNHPADEKGVRSEIRNETRSNGRIECVCWFCVLFCSFAKSGFYLINK